MLLQRTCALIGVVTVAALAAGCSGVQFKSDYPEDRSSGASFGTELLHDADASASARLAPVGGSGVDGAIRFLKYGGQMIVRVKASGLAPYRDYGVHVHEGRGCADDASAIGGHFNPGNAAHGRPGSAASHAGDLPNLRAEADGTAAYSFDASPLTIGAGPTSPIGRVVVISSNADDFRTQPDGNSGKPLACGFIRLDGRAFGTPTK